MLSNIILGCVAILALTIFGYCIYVFFNRPTDTQIKKIQEWLLFAVASAEKELGSGTGQLKIRYVYDMFIVRFPYLVKFISFEAFSGLVDEALEVFKQMLQQNKDVINYVGGENNG